MSDVTVLLRKVADNDRSAIDALFELLYNDLHRMARRAPGAVMDLLPAGDAGGGDQRLLRFPAHRREQAHPADAH